MPVTVASLLVRIDGDSKGAVTASHQAESAFNTATKAGAGFAAGMLTVEAAMRTLKGGISGTVGSAIAWESAMAGVKKTVDGTPEQLNAIAAGLRGMSRELPTSATELARIAESAGQLGVERENILEFTRVIADMGETTNLEGERAATSLARLANITQMPIENIDRLASAVVALGNSGASTESEITDMALRLAGAGTQAGLTEAQILGVANALSSLGIEAEAGGTAFSRVFIEIDKAVADGGQKLEAFAATAGMSAAEFTKAWGADAAGATVAFVEGLGRIEAQGGNVFATLEQLELGEIRVRDALLRASGAGDLFRESLELGTQAWEENTALTDEAAKRYETTAAKLEILRNNFSEVGTAVGTAFLPAIVKGSEAGADFVKAWGALPQSTQAMLAFGVAGTTALPVILTLGEKGAKAVLSLGDAFETGRGKAALFAAGLTAVAVATDLILKETTGAGVFDRLFGDVAKMEGGKEALAEWNALLLASAGRHDELTLATTALDQVVEQFRGTTTRAATSTKDYWEGIARGQFTMETLADTIGGSDRRLFGFRIGLSDTTDRMKEFEAAVTLLGGQLVANQAPLEVIYSYYEKLPAELQKTFDAATNVTRAWEKHRLEVQQGPDALERMVLAQRALATETSVTTHTAGELVTALTHWGPALSQVFGSLDDEGREALKVFQGEIPTTITSAEELSSFLEKKFGPDVAKAFDQFHDKTLEAFEGMKEAWGLLLPSVDESFSQWKKRLDQMAKDYGAFETSLTTIYQEITAAGIAMPDQITAAIAEKGPAFANNFAKLFAEDPQAALDALAVAAPLAMGESVDAIVNRVIGGAPGMEAAVTALIVKPWEAANEAAAAEAAKLEPLIHGNAIDAVLGLTDEAAAAGAAVGEALILGVDNGIRRHADLPAAALANASAAAVAAAQSEIDSHSPSRLSAALVGRPLAQGVALGIQEATPEVLSAVEAFLEAVLKRAGSEEAKAAFGETGASLMEQFADSLENPGSAARLPDLIGRLIDEAEEAGVPNARELGQNLADAIAAGLGSGDSGPVRDALSSITAAVKAAGTLTVESFGAAISAKAADRRLLDQIGSGGKSLMDALDKAIAEGGKKNIDRLADIVDGMQTKLSDKASEAQAAYLGTSMMRALEEAIANNGPEAEARLASVLANINEIMKGGAIDIRTGTVIAADAIRELASAFDIDGQVLIDNIQVLIDSGLTNLSGALDQLPEAARKNITALLEILTKGVYDANTLINQIGANVPGGPKGGGGSGTGAGSPPATSTSQVMPGETVAEFVRRVTGVDVFGGQGSLFDINGRYMSPADIIAAVTANAAKFARDFLYGGYSTGANPMQSGKVTKDGFVPNPPYDGSHAGGLDYVPYDNYIALLHRGEAVLTAQENRAGRSISVGAIQVTLHVAGSLDREAVPMLTASFREAVREVIEEELTTEAVNWGVMPR